MKSIYTKLFNIKKWTFNTIIIVGLLLIIAITLMTIRTKSLTIEGLKIKTTDISLNVMLTDTTSSLTDPNPNGIFNVYTEINSNSNDDAKELIVPYPSKMGELNASFLFDASSAITVLKIEPKDTSTDASNNSDRHKADMFPEKFKIDISMDLDSPKYILSKETGTDSGDANNRASPSTDLSGDEITIVKNGAILDNSSNQIGTAYKGDANPLNPTTKNPFVLNIVLKNAKNISRINIEYKLPIDISGAIAK